MSYNPRSRVGVTVTKFNEVPPNKESRYESGIPESGAISSIRYDSDTLHGNAVRCSSWASRVMKVCWSSTV
jgi:hypothetical protein